MLFRFLSTTLRWESSITKGLALVCDCWAGKDIDPMESFMVRVYSSLPFGRSAHFPGDWESLALTQEPEEDEQWQEDPWQCRILNLQTRYPFLGHRKFRLLRHCTSDRCLVCWDVANTTVQSISLESRLDSRNERRQQSLKQPFFVPSLRLK